MAQRIRIVLLCGGRSVEHEVSILSARNIAASLDRAKYEIHLVYIDREGGWNLIEDVDSFFSFSELSEVGLSAGRFSSRKISPGKISPGGGGPQSLTCRSVPVFFLRDREEVRIVDGRDYSTVGRVDVVFPSLHGPYGEDGTIQGFAKLYGLPCVGAGVTGSAVGMDKDVSKRLLRDAGIPTPRFLVFERHQASQIDFDRVCAELSLPFFIKPANLGSSVGTRKVRERSELERAVSQAFGYDLKILFEEYIEGREIECSVLGSRDNPLASVPGEIRPTHEFYTYDAKYVDKNGAELIIPAPLEAPICRRVQELSAQAFGVLCCEGMARVDFFLRKNGEALVSEINTIPGFTNISMYPKLWEASGVSNQQLMERLVELAIESFRHQMGLLIQTH